MKCWCRQPHDPYPGSLGSPSRRTGKNTPVRRHQQNMTVHKSRAVPGSASGMPVDVQAWRRRRLIEVGFPGAVADVVASDPRFDLHALLQLVDRGCPPELAVRILAPLPPGVAP
jgi:hypothetical protein